MEGPQMPNLRFRPPQTLKGVFLPCGPCGLEQPLISDPSVLCFIKSIPRAASSPFSAAGALQPFPLSTLVFSSQHKSSGLCSLFRALLKVIQHKSQNGNF